MTETKQKWAVFDQNGHLACLPVHKIGERTVVVAGGAKVPPGRLWLLSDADYAPLLAAVRTRAGRTDIESLWRAADGETLTADELASRAGAKTPAEILEILQAALDNPAYFRRREGRLAPADESVLDKVRASLRRREEEMEVERDMFERLEKGDVAEFVRCREDLLAGENKNSAVFRAAKKAAGGEKYIPQWLVSIGACTDARECRNLIFVRDWPQRPQTSPPPPPDIPDSDSVGEGAFSIDDAGTFEVDDAFSAYTNDSGHTMVGIHIAVPALDEGLFTAAEYDKQRLISAYFPDGKVPMLSESHIKAYSLQAGESRMALSWYCRFDPTTGAVHDTETKLNRIVVRNNYCPEDFDDGAPAEVAAAYAMLESFTAVLPPLPARERFDFRILTDPPAVNALPRRPVGLLVEKLMRHINTEWARVIAGYGGLYRANGALTFRPAGDNLYAWLSSPLRRYVDLANQRLLLERLGLTDPAKINWRKLARTFASQQTLARRYQDAAERHFVLSALQALPQESVLEGTWHDKGKVRLCDYPINGPVADGPSCRSSIGEPVQVRIRDIDLFAQRARFFIA